MILSGNSSIAIEAKSTEPRYENVKAWLGGKTEGNRADVLNGWLELLSRVAERPLTREQVEDLPYQLIHRAASACQPDAASRWLVYHVFSASPAAATKYKKDLEKLHELLGAAPPHLRLVWSQLLPTARYSGLSGRWQKGERKLRAEVKEGLAAGEVFTGGQTEVLPLEQAGT
jgi:hypothetical protein